MLNLRSMRKPVLFLAAFWLAAHGALAAPNQDYEFYKVRSGESVEMIASSRGLKPDVLRQMNPALEHVVFPAEGTVIFVPPRPAPPHRAPLMARSGRLNPEKAPPSALAASFTSAAPRSVARPPAAVATGGLSEAEVDAIYDEIARPRLGEVSEGVSLALPEHQNVVITSDGRTISVPCAPPRKKVVEKTPDKVAVTSARGLKVLKLLRGASKYLGVPYVWGGEDPSGMDCSGFTQRVFTENGMYIPRTADVQFEVGRVVPRGEEQPGDLVFFETYCPGASHVGIYVGKHQFMHASSGAGYITFGDLRDEYFSRCYLGARRNW